MLRVDNLLQSLVVIEFSGFKDGLKNFDMSRKAELSSMVLALGGEYGFYHLMIDLLKHIQGDGR